MKKGFIKSLTVITVGACVLFLVFAVAANSITRGTTFSGGGTGSGTGGASGLSGKDYVADYTSRTNPLLDFEGFSSSGSFRSPSGGDLPNASPYAGKVTLSTNGVHSKQPYEEYVTLKNNGAEAVNITGWKLTNNKGTRPVENNSNDYFYPAPESVTIGEGMEFLDPDKNFRAGPIVLKRGDTAILTTGGPFANYSFPIPTSFRENICVGYLNTYPFQPTLTRRCPILTSDPAIRQMTDDCYSYANRVGTCVDPSKTDKKNYDQQTSICRNFMSIRTNYNGCVRDYKNNPNFYTSQWRVFLGKKQEFWASTRETITVYDRNGLVVDQKSY